MIQQGREVVGHLLVGDFVRAIAGPALIPAVHGDHLVARAEVIDLSFEIGDAAAIAVHEQKRLANAVDFVIELAAVVRERPTDGSIRTISRDGLGCGLGRYMGRSMRLSLCSQAALQEENTENYGNYFGKQCAPPM